MSAVRTSVRSSLSGLGFVFAAYLAIGGLLWTGPVAQPSIFVATLALYVVVAGICIYWTAPVSEDMDRDVTGFGPRSVLPVPAVLLALATALIAPSASWLAVSAPARLESFATWSLGGIGALMTIVMVRRRPWVAWVGVGILSVQSFLWIGVSASLAYGLVGAFVWVGGAQLLTWLIDRAARDARQMNRVQRSAEAWLAVQDASGRERRVRVRQALAIAGPILARTIETGGQLTTEEQEEARLAEARLRDELRGGKLLDEAVRERIDAVRATGASVTVLDEGGLEGIENPGLQRVRQELAEILADVGSDQLIIRAAAHDLIAVTVVGRSSAADGDDTVDLWREIRRPA